AVALVRAARVAVVGARGAGRRLGVGGTRRARAGARLPRIALARRRAAERARVARRMLAGVVRPVALFRAVRVAVVGARRARRVLRVGGARGGRSRTVLRRVALARGRTADRARRPEGIGRAGAARSGADLVEVAVARRGAADRAGVAGRVLAEVARAVAGVGGAGVPVVGAERRARLLGVRPARLARQPAAALGDVALPGRRPADGPDRQEGIGRARRARAGADLIRVARVARARPAEGARIAGRMLAGIVRAVAEVGRAHVAVVGARRPRGRLRVGRAARAVAG